VPMECASGAVSVAAVNQSPGTNRTGSAVPVPCSPTDLVDVAAAAPDDGQRTGSHHQGDDDITSRLEQLHAWSGSVAGSHTVPARLHQQSDTHNQHPHQRTPLRNVFSCGTGKYISIHPRIIQELSYRQQIGRQLRTQYAEGIYRLKCYTVTLKSRLRVTQGHWKRNHSIDHTRLSSSRVI